MSLYFKYCHIIVFYYLLIVTFRLENETSTNDSDESENAFMQRIIGVIIQLRKNIFYLVIVPNTKVSLLQMESKTIY